MLQGKELAAAIVSAMEKKRALPGFEKIGPTALGRALSMSQPSASELLTTGRLSKEKLPALLAYFQDVVGPDHFGLPFSKFEMEFLSELRSLPGPAQQDLLQRLQKANETVRRAVDAFAEEEGFAEVTGKGLALLGRVEAALPNAVPSPGSKRSVSAGRAAPSAPGARKRTA